MKKKEHHHAPFHRTKREVDAENTRGWYGGGSVVAGCDVKRWVCVLAAAAAAVTRGRITRTGWLVSVATKKKRKNQEMTLIFYARKKAGVRPPNHMRANEAH